MHVSIITPSFNQGNFIERTILSVLHQRLYLPSSVRLDHIIFDSLSTDNTLEILQHYDDIVYHWVSEKDEGQAHAVNKGMAFTDSDVIGWLNSDDIYYSGAIARVVEFFNNNSDVDVVYGMTDHIDEFDQIIEPYPSEPWNFNRLKEVCFICQPALFLRRRVVEKHGMLDESLHYCMDYEYWLRLGEKGVRFAYLESKLAGSRMYDNNKTLSCRPKVHVEINDMMKAKFKMVPNKWIFNYAHAKTDRSPYGKEHLDSSNFNFLFFLVWGAWKWNRNLFFVFNLVLVPRYRVWLKNAFRIS